MTARLPAVLSDMRSHNRIVDQAMAAGRAITADEKRRTAADPFAEADRLLAKLDADEARRRQSIGEGLATMAEARADLLASPLHADDPTAPERRLSALDAARRYRTPTTQLDERIGE